MPRHAPIETLYRAQFTRLVGFARTKGAGPEEAEEIVQDAFARLARYGAREKIRNDIAFLRTIIVNLIRDRYRSRAASPPHVDYDEMDHDPASPSPGPESAYGVKQALQLTLADLDALPALTKEVFVRYRLKGETYEQIARACEVTIAVVRRHLRDAMIFLVKQRGQREDG
ncbi:RNA polymerase sigma factor [Henriciella aquimarina]|uniref:RNA polymerase sigma factor n=1 Tax=Henriciella aquimarina TaxID=545261 RepID=UPI001F418D83|nr:RNA polymerase sigma factor [Henriciella aquimarina]